MEAVLASVGAVPSDPWPQSYAFTTQHRLPGQPRVEHGTRGQISTVYEQGVTIALDGSQTAENDSCLFTFGTGTVFTAYDLTLIVSAAHLLVIVKASLTALEVPLAFSARIVAV
jgi:hypothetical protein